MPDRPGAVIRVVIYSRPGCHLCDEMKAVVELVSRSIPLQIDEIDISNDADLESRYGIEIPVLEIEGKKAAKYRVGEAELLRILAGRTHRPDGGGG